jgi:DNA-3-methyladenine glycosylase
LKNGKNLMAGSPTELNRLRLGKEFFSRDVLELAPDLLGKHLVVKQADDSLMSFAITETEAYRGNGDRACHASRGKTERNSIMFSAGGHVYIYLIYGMYWMLNFVGSTSGNPQAALVRGIQGCYGPGRLTRKMGIDKSFYGEDAALSDKIWIEDSGTSVSINTGRRIGVEYAGEEWAAKPWRYFTDELRPDRQLK